MKEKGFSFPPRLIDLEGKIKISSLPLLDKSRQHKILPPNIIRAPINQSNGTINKTKDPRAFEP